MDELERPKRKKNEVENIPFKLQWLSYDIPPLLSFLYKFIRIVKSSG